MEKIELSFQSKSCPYQIADVYAKSHDEFTSLIPLQDEIVFSASQRIAGNNGLVK